MSTTVDQRVVEMRFDNKHFEQNVSTTMSTLDKLKQKLHLDGATKGLEDINAASRNIKMDGLGNAIEGVSAKFSALQVIGVTALANITNSAVNAGIKIAKALTIDPVMSGFNEYETKMGSIQTILANTEHQGTTMDDVTRALEELNLYADKTIYNFQEMTRNIGTFTAAGVDLDTSVKSIQGIANLAAVSGSTSQQASTAMYQLSQALATGTVKLMDWNSVVNAGMGGKVFQNALIRTAAMLDGAADDVEAWQARNVDSYGSFRDSLSQGAWLTSEVLTETLKQFTMAAEEGTEEWEAYKKSLMDQGYAEEQAEAILKMANTATDAATKVKTFTQLFDTLKETAQSGWAKTWELIFGDFEEAKEFFTGLSTMIGGFIDSMSEWRNNLLGGALNSNWDKLIDKINKAGIKTTDYEEKIREVAEAHGINSDKLDEIIAKHGTLEKAIKAGAISSDILKEALSAFGIGVGKSGEKIAGFVEGIKKIERLLGWGSVGEDVKSLQTALEALGHSVGECKIDGIIGPDTTKAIKEFQKEVGITVDGIAGPETLAALEKAGTSLEEVAGEADKADASYEDLIDNITEKGGRELFLEGFSNVINGLIGVFRALGSAWSKVFPAENAQKGLFNAIKGFRDFTESLRLFEEVTDENGNTVIKFNENGEKLVRTFEGVFAILDMVTTVIGGGLKIALKVVSTILGYFNLNLLDITAAVGDAAVAVNKWFDSIFDISGILDKVVPLVKNAADAVRDWYDKLKNTAGVQNAIKYIQKLGAGIKEWWSNLLDNKLTPTEIAEGIVNAFSNIPKVISKVFSNIWSGLKDSFSGTGESPLSGFIDKLKEGLGTAGEVVSEIGRLLLDKLNGFLSKHGFKEISSDSIAGLVEGFKEGASKVWNSAVEMVKNLVEKVKGFLGIASPSKVFYAIGGFIIAGLIAGLQNGIPDSLGAVKDVFQPMLDWIKGIDLGGVIAAILGIFTAKTANKAVNALAMFASPFEGLGDVFEGVGKVLKKSARPIAKVIKSTSKVVKSFAGVLKGVKFNLYTKGIQTLGKTLLMLVAAIVVLTLLDPKEMWNAVAVILALSVILGILAFAMGKINDASLSVDKNGLNMSGFTSGMGSIGMAILLVAAAAKIIGTMDPDQYKQAFEGLAQILLTLGSLILTFGIVGHFVTDKSAENFDKMGKTLAKMAIAIGIIALVAKMLGGMERDQLTQGGIAVGIAAGILTAFVVLTGLFVKGKTAQNFDKIGKTLMKMALAIGVMALVAAMLGHMDPTALAQGVEAVGLFSGLIIILMAATRLIGGNAKMIEATGGTLLKIAGAIGIMALVVKLVGGMDPTALDQGISAIGAFCIFIVGLMAATRLIAGDKEGRKSMRQFGSTILSIAGAIAIMAGVAFMLSMISWDGFAKGTGMILIFSGIIVGLMAATKLIGRGGNVEKIGTTLIAVAGAIGILALIAVLLGLVPSHNLDKGIDAVAKLTILMMGLIAVTSIAKDCLGNLIAITVAIAVLAGAVYLLSTVDAFSLEGAVRAMESLLIVFGLVIVATRFAGNAMKTLLAISVAIGVLGYVLYQLAELPVESVIGSAIALSGLLIVVSGVLILLAKMNISVPAALKGILGLTLMAIPLLAFVGVLALMQNVQNAMNNVLALSVLAGATTLLLIPLTIIGTFAGQALLGVLALTAMAIPLLAFVGVLALMQNVQNAMTNVMALALLMTTIGDVLFKISLVAPLAIIAVAALTALGILMGAFGVLAVAIGALVTEFPQIQTFLDVGIPIMEQLASGLGSIIGSFISAFAGEVMTILPQLGLCLSQFMANAMVFITGAKMVDEKVRTGVGILAAAIIALTVADLINGITTLLPCVGSLADLGTQLSQFMINALPFITTAMLIKPEMLEGVRALADTILIITAANVLQGLTSFLTGGSSLENFAAQLPILGQGITAFSNSLGTFSEDQLTTVNCAAQAIKTLAQASAEIPNTGGLLGQLVGENDLGAFAAQFPVLGSGLRMFLDTIGVFTDEQVATVNCAAQAIKLLAEASSEIPNSGGLLADIVGENDLGTFAAQFPILGSGLRAFLDNVGVFTDEQVATVDCAARAIKLLAEASSEIPNSGGWLAQIVGENDLGTFADQFPVLGTGLRGFLDNAGTFTDEQVSTVDCAARAIKLLAQASSEIPNSGGWVGAIVGENDLGTFADQFPMLGEGLRGFLDNIGTFTSEQVSTVYAAVGAVNALSNLANADLKNATKNLSDFGDDLPAFASDIGDFCANMPSSDSMTNAVDNLDKLLYAVDSIGDANSGCLSTFAENLKQVGTDAVDKFVKAFTSNTVKTDLQDAAKKLGDKVIDGIEDKESAIKTAGEDAAKKAVDGVETQKDDMEDAGEDLGAGLVKGIKSKEDAAYNAGYKLGQKAVKGEKDGQKSSSPSKLTILAGQWLGEGLVIGMGRMADKVYSGGYTLGKTATDAMSNTISKIADTVNTDIDSQPTIRPVLDLSDVKSGASALNSMLDTTSQVGVRANISSISSMMNNRRQNGVNDDVVSAIDRLNKRMDNMPRNTYSINGITVTEGSDAANAIQALVRTIKIEGRS